ncbi:hypothetical protein JCGZ_25105 [Jatropha curcas]|uniref:Homeobox domain-containing protein n=1 Tax=Jatropha curcas TaxID=180498 RepID=A0A067JKN1_JATCU|nr:BEL1-like homeodomain protein 9 [Jatropha curcas]KDP24541.1 hypothetical protein JCGZ_25105 [Jatropha curcas]
MVEGFEPYHVPQQSRRDKLRVVAQSHPDLHGSTGLLHNLCYSSLICSDLLACANNSLSAVSEACKANPVCVAKEEGANLISFVGGIVNNADASSSSTTHHFYLDPQSYLPLNPSSIQDINGITFLYTPHNVQNLRDIDQPFKGGGDEAVAFKPEPLSLTRESSQGLSLSLSSHHTQQSNLPLELNLQRYGSAVYIDKVTTVGGGGGRYTVPDIVGASGSTSNELSRSSVPLGPFTGYASILQGSRFLKPAQQLLAEFCDVGRGIYSEKITVDGSLMDPPFECLNSCGIVDEPHNCGDGGESRRKKSKLIRMLDEVHRRYKHYYQQMQAVVASFECVAGLSNAAPYANLALKAVSKHFKSLKNAITDQLQFNIMGHGQVSHVKEETSRFGNIDKNLYVRPVQNSGFIEHQPVWRPQRGLPERAVIVLRAWLFEHFLHPYPTDTDKLMLAKQTGLSRSQVSNWFINARVRLWKPMVEEIHMLETRQAQKSSQMEEQNAKNSSDQVPPSDSVVSDNPSTSTRKAQDVPPKRTRNGLPNLPSGNEEPLNLSYNSLSSHSPVGVGISTTGRSSGVSLTLGLHQNNGIGLSEPFPMHAAQCFGLGPETSSEGFVMGGFETQNRHF